MKAHPDNTAKTAHPHRCSPRAAPQGRGVSPHPMSALRSSAHSAVSPRCKYISADTTLASRQFRPVSGWKSAEIPVPRFLLLCRIPRLPAQFLELQGSYPQCGSALIVSFLRYYRHPPAAARYPDRRAHLRKSVHFPESRYPARKISAKSDRVSAPAPPMQLFPIGKVRRRRWLCHCSRR